MKQINGYAVFWTAFSERTRSLTPYCEVFESNKMSAALKFADELRKDSSNQFITMTSQNNNCVGKQGVDTVANGKLPNGEKYEWVMRRPPVSNINLTDEQIVKFE